VLQKKLRDEARTALRKAMQRERAARPEGSSEAVEVSEMQVRHLAISIYLFIHFSIDVSRAAQGDAAGARSEARWLE